MSTEPDDEWKQIRVTYPDGGIPVVFLSHAAEILADTGKGLSGSQIIKVTAAYAVEYDITIPHQSYPFDAPNKRTALLQNLMAFPGHLQYKVLKQLCEDDTVQRLNRSAAEQLRVTLVTRYGYLDDHADAADLNPTLVEETKHWLNKFPAALDLYQTALTKQKGGVFLRNLLDDLRLALEMLLKVVLANDKSLENQRGPLGAFVQGMGGSKEFTNMFGTLVDYFTKYQNTYVKHDDAVLEEEVEFVFELTSSLMKHVVRLHNRRGG